MKLNPQQMLIVDHPADGSCLVMAGPGSGKTTVIAHRALKLAPKIAAGKVLQMLTFSNKASKEMKERVKRINGLVEGIKFDTFHSFGLRLMKDDPAGYGMVEGFSLLSDNDKRRSVRQLAKALGLAKDIPSEDKKRLDPVAWHNTWSLAKQAGFNVNNPDNKKALCDRLTKSHRLVDGEVELAWRTMKGYELEKQQSNSVDFDDLLYLPLLRLASDEQYRDKVRGGIGYIMVDESQDTNRIQYELVRHIGLGYCGVTCVGDDDQSIYGWRGAEISNMKRFLTQFKAEERRLEQNYRSTKAIVNSAVDLIDHNTDRLSKRPFSEGETGDLPTAVNCSDSRIMADEIASSIQAEILKGTSPKEIAVLYRTNRMALLIEQGLRRKGIAYHVVGGMSLFDRAEVVAVTSAMRVALNPKDVSAIKSLTQFIDGFGASSSYALIDAMKDDESISISKLPASIPGVSERSMKAVKSFMNALQFDALLKSSARDFVEWCATGPMRIIEREKDDQLRAKREQHLESLATDIDDELRERKEGGDELTWRDVLMEVALRDARQSESADEQVTLSTIHRAKGLEWEMVLVAGMSEGIMPLDSRSDVSEEDAGYMHMEEERRLGYVGLTRAKRKCVAYHADQYFFPGTEPKIFDPSRFIAEMGISATQQSNDFDDDETFDGQQYAPEPATGGSFKEQFNRLSRQGMGN